MCTGMLRFHLQRHDLPIGGRSEQSGVMGRDDPERIQRSLPRAAARAMKILLVHGIGHSDQDPNYYQSWVDAITAGLRRGGMDEPAVAVPRSVDGLSVVLPFATQGYMASEFTFGSSRRLFVSYHFVVAPLAW